MASRKTSKIKLHTGNREELDHGEVIEIEGNTYPDYVGMAIRYCDGVLAKRIPACKYIILAAQRFLDMYEAANNNTADYYWSDEHAIEPCAFAETLKQTTGDFAGVEFTLQPWQMWTRCAVYGFRKKSNGKRLVRFWLEEIARKNGKSFDAAATGLYEMGPAANKKDDGFIVAPSENLALKVLEPMQDIVEQDEDMQAFYGSDSTKKMLEFKETSSSCVVLPANGKKQDGHNPKYVIADEFHSIPGPIYNVMRSSQGSRKESMFLAIGTAGYEVFGPGWEERLVAIDVLEGKLNRPDMFAAIFTIDQEDLGNWTSPRVIRKANPNLGVSLDEDAVMIEIAGIQTNPRNKNEVLRTRFNVWGLGESRLISHDQWAACYDDELVLKGREAQSCYIGVDLASRNDMVAWVAEFYDADGNSVFFAKHYVPEQGPWRDDEDVRDLYMGWHESGHLIFTPGSHHTCDEIEQDLIKFTDDFTVDVIAIDDREANHLMSSLAKHGKPVISFRKNATNYSEPTKDLVARAVGKHKAVRHDGNPILAWNVENTIGGMNTAEMLLPKKVTEHSNMKIDGFDAMVMSHACVMEHADLSKINKPNPMADRGVRIL